jgi:hypothetical protein
LSHLDGPDLLQEKLEGRSAPDTLPTKDERKPQDTPRSSDFSHAYRESLKERELEAEEKPAATEREEAPEVPKEKEYEGFHVLNDELQATRQQIERMSQAQQQREREMHQWLQQSRAPQPQQQGPAIEEYLSQELGLQDPQALMAYKDAILQEFRKEQTQHYNQQIMPVLVQQQRDRFELAYNRQKEALPNFDKYFNRDGLRQLHEQLVRSHGINHVATVDWDAQLLQAYRSADYARLEAEYKKLEKVGKKEVDAKDAQKAKQKENLSKVPKAHTDSGSSTSGNWKKEIDNIPSSVGFKSFGREMLRVISKRA